MTRGHKKERLGAQQDKIMDWGGARVMEEQATGRETKAKSDKQKPWTVAGSGQAAGRRAVNDSNGSPCSNSTMTWQTATHIK